MAEVIVTEQVSEEAKTEVVETTPKFTPDQMQKRIDDLTKENEKYRKSKSEAVATEKKAKETALAEQGKYKELYETTLKDVETSKKNLSNVEKKNALRLALTEAGAKHPELLEGLFKDGDNWNFELDESGKIKDLDILMDPIKESYKSVFTETILVGDGAPKVNHGNDTKNIDQLIKESEEAGNVMETIRLKNSKHFNKE